MALFSHSSTIDVTAPVDVIQARLAPFVKARPQFNDAFRPGPLFFGGFSHEGFRLRRKTMYRNSVRPTVNAVFRPHHEGTYVDLRMAPANGAHILTGILLAFFAVIGVMGWVIVITGHLSGSFDAWSSPVVNLLVIPAVFTALPILVAGSTVAAFKYEVSAARRDLGNILAGHLDASRHEASY